MSAITTEEVARLAALALIDLEPNELADLATHLTEMVKAVSVVSQVAGAEVKPSIHPIERANVFREDIVQPSLGAQLALQAAPASQADQFKVPQIMGEDQ